MKDHCFRPHPYACQCYTTRTSAKSVGITKEKTFLRSTKRKGKAKIRSSVLTSRRFLFLLLNFSSIEQLSAFLVTSISTAPPSSPFFHPVRLRCEAQSHDESKSRGQEKASKEVTSHNIVETTKTGFSNLSSPPRICADRYFSKQDKIPPWISRYNRLNIQNSTIINDNSCDTSNDKALHNSGKIKKAQNEKIECVNTKSSLDLLQSSLQLHPKFRSNHDEIEDIIHSIFTASNGEEKLIHGASDFLCLLLQIEENGLLEHSDITTDFKAMHSSSMTSELDSKPEMFTFLNRNTLIAASFHYCDSIVAREEGIYDFARAKMRSPTLMSNMRSERSSTNPLFFGKKEGSVCSIPIDIVPTKMRNNLIQSEDRSRNRAVSDSDFEFNDSVFYDTDTSTGTSNIIASPKNNKEGIKIVQVISQQSQLQGGIEQYGQEATNIAKNAMQIKEAEVMADAVLPDHIGAVTPSLADAATLRGLLLIVTEDWRALLIRIAATLYRLEGINFKEKNKGMDFLVNSSLSEMNTNDISQIKKSVDFSENKVQVLRVAREALRIYAPLAQRLGMQGLKSKLEDMAFQILYPRQFTLATSLYETSGSFMQSVASFVAQKIETVLMEDAMLTKQLEYFSVKSRVKQPFSLWTKFVKKGYVKFIKPSQKQTSTSMLSSETSKETTFAGVNDTIALRVVLCAKTMSPTEKDESLEAREELLCYYVQKILLDQFATDRKRIKDYIRTPKENGYQSLHHISSVFLHGQEWPFEIQVRTELMHRAAEFGGAAHWDYKMYKKNSIVASSATQKKSFLKKSGVRLVNKQSSSSSDVNSSLTNSTSSKSTESRCTPIANQTAKSGNYNFQNDKAGKKNSSKINKKKVVNSHIEALTSARQDLLKKVVHVFVSPSCSALDGKIVALPQGSSIVDTFKEMVVIKKNQEEFDWMLSSNFFSFEVYLNGHAANLNDTLSNGDVVTLPKISDELISNK